MNTERARCAWPKIPLALEYHDREWGVPQYDDRVLFEFLVLEGAQAGLSWDTILKKRLAYRRAFDNFEVEKVAAYGRADVQRLLRDEGIVRNRLKIESAISNAGAFLKVQHEFGSFAAYQWRFVDGKPIQNRWKTAAQIPASSSLSEKMSRDLRARGFRFVGPTIVYAHMQAVGMVNDHTLDCFRHADLAG